MSSFPPYPLLFWLLPNPTLSPLHTCLPKDQVSLSCPKGLPLIHLIGDGSDGTRRCDKVQEILVRNQETLRSYRRKGLRTSGQAGAGGRFNSRFERQGWGGSHDRLRSLFETQSWAERCWELLSWAWGQGSERLQGTQQVAGDNCQTGHLFSLCSYLATSQRYCWPLKGQGKASQTDETCQQKEEPQWPRQLHPGKREAACWVLCREC